MLIWLLHRALCLLGEHLDEGRSWPKSCAWCGRTEHIDPVQSYR